MAWVPSNNFEEEIVNSQPDYDFIFGCLSEPEPTVFYPRPRAHLEFAAKQKVQKQQQAENSTKSKQNQKLSVIAKVQRIAGTKPLGEQPTEDDWNDNKNVERETVALMRHFGYGPSVEEPLDEACTIATRPITEEMKVMQNGNKRIPIFFGEEFFKLKPRVSDSSSERNSSADTVNSPSVSGENSVLSEATDFSGSVDGDVLKEQCVSQCDDSEQRLSVEEYSGEGTNTNFESAKSEESYATAHNSGECIPTLNFYRSGHYRNGTDSLSRQPTRYYTVRELYEKKRHS